MATDTYLDLLGIVSGYLADAKAREVIARQMAKCGSTPETLQPTDLKKISQMVAGAAGLYVADPNQRRDLARKVEGLVSG